MAVVAAVVLVWVVFWAGTGDVDPVGGLVGVGGLVAAVWAGLMARRTLVWQDTDTAGLADRLADVVARQEEQAHRQLLGGTIRTIDVAFDFTPTPAHNADGAAPTGTLNQIAGYYRRLRPGRLVVTGASGAGKTVLAVHLMLHLLHDREGGEAVPVRMALSGFEPDRQTLDEWVADRLVRDYRLKPRAAQALVMARRVLPVLDGLDEMDEDEPAARPARVSRAAAAVRRINAYLDGTIPGQLIVTCRSTPYEVLEGEGAWAQDAARITLRPVTAEAAWDFLTTRIAGAGRWEPVLDAIAQDPDGPLAGALSTPWRLTVAAAVYDRRRPDGTWDRYPTELLDPALNTVEKVRDHLHGLLIPAATLTSDSGAPGTASTTPAAYTPDQVRAWLTVLAAYLHTNTETGRTVGGRRLPGTDLVLHELWPLAGTHHPRNTHALLTATPLLALGLGGFWPGGLLVSSFLILAVVASARVWWPMPARVDVTAVRTSAGRRRLVADLVLSVVVGIVVGLVFGLKAGMGFGLGLAGVLVGAVGSGGTPRGNFRGEFAFIFVVCAFEGFVFGVVYGLTADIGVGHTVALGFAAGLVLGLVLGFMLGVASTRYLALLLCTRRWWAQGVWLPFRLGRFLDWCCEAGLMRTAGAGYQFRHRELQGFLARAAP
ncbi:NACHT domain-containing protein [Streptomyces sparsus]